MGPSNKDLDDIMAHEDNPNNPNGASEGGQFSQAQKGSVNVGANSNDVNNMNNMNNDGSGNVTAGGGSNPLQFGAMLNDVNAGNDLLMDDIVNDMDDVATGKVNETAGGPTKGYN